MQELPGRDGVYRLDAVVARGRSGEVFRAEDPEQRRVAIKLFDRVVESECEIAALRATRNDRVVCLIESGEHTDGRAWMATTWVEGRTLEHVLSTEGPLSLERGHRIVTQLAEAVDAVHDAGFVHGDVSPRNVMVDLHDQVTLIDLAASTPIDSQRHESERHGATTTAIDVEGTPRYASPEVAAGLRASPASDRYAVGLIAYESIIGAFPFPEVATPIAMLAHHAGTPPLAPSEQRPSLSSAVDDILLRSLDKLPEQRPARAAEIAAGLVATGAERSSIGRHRSSARRGRAPIVIAAIVLLVAIGVAAAVLRTWSGADQLSAVDRDEASAVAIPESIRALETPGPAGRARGIACNLLEYADFEQASAVDHYYAGDVTNTVAVASEAGVAGSAALEVGAEDTFGLFGEVVPIGQLTNGVPGSPFVFSVWARVEGEPIQTGIYVDYLDADFERLSFERDALAMDVIGAAADGERVTVVSEAPAAAAFAVPTAFKDGSGGSLLIDEAVFAPVDRCVGAAP